MQRIYGADSMLMKTIIYNSDNMYTTMITTSHIVSIYI